MGRRIFETKIVDSILKIQCLVLCHPVRSSICSLKNLQTFLVFPHPCKPALSQTAWPETCCVDIIVRVFFCGLLVGRLRAKEVHWVCIATGKILCRSTCPLQTHSCICCFNLEFRLDVVVVVWVCIAKTVCKSPNWSNLIDSIKCWRSTSINPTQRIRIPSDNENSKRPNPPNWLN